MAGPKPQDVYQGYNASPSGIADTDSPAGRGPRFDVQANPNDFGAQVGGALEQAGKTGEQIGNQFSEVALQQLGRDNETAATAAETALINKNAQAKADFMSLEGSQAVAALPAYQKTLQDNFTSLRQGLPGGAARMFDMTGIRQNANYNSEAVSYAAAQDKRANMMAHLGLINATTMQANNPNLDAGQIGALNGTIAYSHGAMLDENHPGLIQDQDGNFNYSDNAEGQQLKANTQEAIQHSQGIVWQNAITAKANVNPLDAQQFYQDHKDSISPMAQVRIEAFLNPKVDNYKTDGIVNTSINMANQQHRDFVLNPQNSNSSNPNNLGNVKTAEGASQGAMQFLNPATPVDGVIATANNLRTNYQGMTIQQMSQKWTGESPEKATAWANNVSIGSGLPVLATPNLNDPEQLSSLMKGIATAEKSPQDRSLFNDQVISQGVQSSLSGKQATLLPPAQKQGYATNPDGSPISRADYYASHREEILANGAAMAERDFPGNPTYQGMVRERLTQQMDAAIKDQQNQYKQDNQYVTKAIFGELTKGNVPATYQELRAIPNVGPVLDRVYSQDPKFAEGIDRMLAQANRKDTNVNSANGYDTIMRTLEPEDNPNRISSQDHLDKLLGRTDGTGINMKDYKDAKASVEASDQWKSFVSQHMKDITSANGNVDGQGQQRALQWYGQVTKQKQINDSMGDKAMPENAFIQSIKDTYTPHMPSRIEQISNWAKTLVNGKKDQQPETVTVVSPTGQIGTIPAGNLDKALAAGYKRSQ